MNITRLTGMSKEQAALCAALFTMAMASSCVGTWATANCPTAVAQVPGSSGGGACEYTGGDDVCVYQNGQWTCNEPNSCADGMTSTAPTNGYCPATGNNEYQCNQFNVNGVIPIQDWSTSSCSYTVDDGVGVATGSCTESDNGYYNTTDAVQTATLCGG